VKEPETQLDIAEKFYDELVTVSVKLANLVAEHSETDYSHEDPPFELKEFEYLDSEVEERLTSSIDASYFNCSEGPDLIEYARILLYTTEEALNHISPAISPEEYTSKELVHKNQNLYQELEKIQNFLEESEINEEAMDAIKTNSERYPIQNHGRVEFEIPEITQPAVTEQKESVN